MQIWIGFNRVTVEVIEWSGIDRVQPAAFLVGCPKCDKTNWSKTADLYKAYDKTNDNFRCKHCNLGKLRPEELKRKKTCKPIDFNVFNPKQVGWCKTNNNAS